MTPEEKELLEKTYKLSLENNEMLKGMRRSQRMGTAMKATYWVLIIVLSIVGYFGAQAYIGSLLGAINDGNPDKSSSTGLIDQYKQLLNGK